METHFQDNASPITYIINVDTPHKVPLKQWRPIKIPQRVVLAVMSFFGFFINYMLRVNINIAIVEMVRAPLLDASHPLGEGGCLIQQDNHTIATSNWSTPTSQAGGEFDWDVHEQGQVLGSFYWSYVITLIPGAMLADKLGTKMVFGGANIVSVLVALLTPVAARFHYRALLFARIMQGLVSGVTWPAMHVMVSRWIPPHERSKFVTTYYGNSVGTAVTYPLCGLLIDHLGWEYAFYVPGALGAVWCLLWWGLVFDSPASHPRISREEKEMIERAVGPHLARKQPPVPWWSMVRSLPLWAIMISNFGGVWTFLALLTYGPNYLKNVHGFGIQMNGLLSGLPNVCRFVVALLFSWFADHLLRTRGWSITRVRKLATVTALIPPGLLCLLLTNIGCNAPVEVAIIIVLTGLGGCASSGPLANTIDLAPNFSGLLLAIVSLLSMSSGYIIPPIISSLISEQPSSMAQWRIMFSLTAGISFFGCIVYLLLGSGEVQVWNSPNKDELNPKDTKDVSTPLNGKDGLRFAAADDTR